MGDIKYFNSSRKEREQTANHEICMPNFFQQKRFRERIIHLFYAISYKRYFTNLRLLSKSVRIVDSMFLPVRTIALFFSHENAVSFPLQIHSNCNSARKKGHISRTEFSLFYMERARALTHVPVYPPFIE